MGRWPWPRTRTAEIIQRLAEGGARVIALDILMNEPDENSRLVLARTLAERYRALGLARTSGPAAGLRPALEERPGGRRHRRDARPGAWPRLAASSLPYFFVFPRMRSRPLDDEGQRLLNRSRVVGFASADAEQAIQPRRADGVQLPLARFITASAANGHVNVHPDDDGALRRVELVIRLGDGLYPSLPLETARLALGLSRTRVRLTAEPGDPARVNRRPDGRQRRPACCPTTGRRARSRHIPAVDVLTDSAPPAVKDHDRPRGVHRARADGRPAHAVRLRHAGRREPRDRRSPTCWRARGLQQLAGPWSRRDDRGPAAGAGRAPAPSARRRHLGHRGRARAWPPGRPGSSTLGFATASGSCCSRRWSPSPWGTWEA